MKKQTEITIVWANEIAKYKYDERHLIINLPINGGFFLNSTTGTQFREFQIKN